jgi:hypothetical protein
MADLNGFDANTVEPSSPLEILPAGDYLAAIVESEKRATSKGDGAYHNFTFQILDGAHKGRKVWARLNLDNKNNQAVQIARAELSAICRAVGVMQPKDSVDLHNLPLIISVKCRKRADTGDIVNEIKGYKPRNQAGTPATAAASGSPPGGSAPWKR